MSFTSFYGPQALSLLLTSVARRSWAVPLCRLQSLLSSNSKLLALCRLASALSQLLLAVDRSVDSDGIILKYVVECCPPFVGSTTLSSPVSPLKQLQTTSPWQSCNGHASASTSFYLESFGWDHTQVCGGVLPAVRGQYYSVASLSSQATPNY